MEEKQNGLETIEKQVARVQAVAQKMRMHIGKPGNSYFFQRRDNDE